MCRYYKGFHGSGLRGDIGFKNCKTQDNDKVQKQAKEQGEAENGNKHYCVNLALEDFDFQFIQLILELEYKNSYCIENICFGKKEKISCASEDS